MNVIRLGDITLGDGEPFFIAGPCVIESEDHAGSPGDDEEEDLHFFVSILTEAYGEKAVEYLPGQTEPVVVRFADPAPPRGCASWPESGGSSICPS